MRLTLPACLLPLLILVASSRALEPAVQDSASAPRDQQSQLSAAELAAELAAGELLLRRGQAPEAVGALARCASLDWPLRQAALALRAEALLVSGDAAAALESADAARAQPGAHGPEVAWIRARALASLGNEGAAGAMLALADDDSGLDAQRRAQALVRAAELFEQSGRLADAARAYRRAAFDAPAAAPADALERSLDLSARAGQPMAQPTTADRLELARALRRAQLHARAVAEYRRAEKGLSGPSLVAARLARARSHFDLRENDEARAACTQILGLSPGPDTAADCRLLIARAAWRVGDGAVVLTQVESALKDARLRQADARPDLRLIEGNYHLEQGRYEEAIKAFNALIAEHPKSSKAGEARWRIAWCRMHQGRHGDAASEFARLASEQAGGELERIGALWSALARERAGETSTEALSALARKFPWTYQGQQARELLALRLEPVALAAAEAEWLASGRAMTSPGSPDLSGDAGLRYALLRDAGLHAWSLAEIESLQPARGRSDAFAFELARARARAGKAATADALLRSRFSSSLAQPSRRSPREFWEVIYPLPMPQLVREASARHGVDPALCAAIIRSESGWDQSARSWADARGLMQLLPATAAPLAKQEGLTDFDGDMLFDPKVNVALGARHLGALLQMFSGDLDAAIASYNAGEDKVAAWWAEFEKQGVPAADRVERIPYRETRQYVRRVRESMGWYAWLFSEPGDAS